MAKLKMSAFILFLGSPGQSNDESSKRDGTFPQSLLLKRCASSDLPKMSHMRLEDSNHVSWAQSPPMRPPQVSLMMRSFCRAPFIGRGFVVIVRSTCTGYPRDERGCHGTQYQIRPHDVIRLWLDK